MSCLTRRIGLVAAALVAVALVAEPGDLVGLVDPLAAFLAGRPLAVAFLPGGLGAGDLRAATLPEVALREGDFLVGVVALAEAFFRAGDLLPLELREDAFLVLRAGAMSRTSALGAGPLESRPQRQAPTP